MSEPDISTLARRLAEQNNVDWRSLNGSGPDGKVVERDVLDYLSRVMAGSEALDPTPEPLPDGMEAWPEQDLAAFRQGVGEGAPGLESLRDEIASSAREASSVAEAYEQADEPAVETVAFGRRGANDSGSDDGGLTADSAGAGQAGGADELLGEDIFLFDDEASPSVTVPDVAEAIDPVDELDDLLVAGDDDFGAAAPSADYEDDADTAAVGFEADGELDGLVAAEERIEAAVEEFVADATEQAREEFGDFSVSGFSSSAYGADEEELPDLFGEADDGDAGRGTADFETSEVFASSDDDVFEQDVDDVVETGSSVAASFASEAEEAETVEEFQFDAGWASGSEAEASVGEAVVEEPVAVGFTADEPEWSSGRDAFVAEFDELAADAEVDDAVDDSVETRELAAPVAFAAGELPLARTANLLRRNVDLTSLASAQLAVSLELGNAEPLSVAPFLLRAVAKAAVETGLPPGPIALAELTGSVRLRRVDDAGSRSFASLVGLLEGPFEEEDEPALAVADLGPLDLDEVILDLSVPVVSLGRVLYDTQRGGYRSTLALSGSLAPDSGARLLARVAELLDAPVRLVL